MDLELIGIEYPTFYENGVMRNCKLNVENVIHTIYGDFVPRHTGLDFRRKDTYSLSFYQSGGIKSIELEEQSVVHTAEGDFDAELITFYENGAIDSLFPVNGSLTFGWSEKDEEDYLKPSHIVTKAGTFDVKLNAVRFYESGALRSVLLWPTHTLTLTTLLGEMPVKGGFRLYEDGSVASFDTASPVEVETPIGKVNAFNPLAMELDLYLNTIELNTDGTLKHIATCGDVIIVHKIAGVIVKVEGRKEVGLLEDSYPFSPPLGINFFDDEEMVRFDNGYYKMDMAVKDFFFSPKYIHPDTDTCMGDCSTCSLCNEKNAFV